MVVPSLMAGGLERVMSELATYFASKKDVKVYLIILTRGEKFYSVSDKVSVIEPDFNYKDYNRPVFTIKTMKYLRGNVRKIKPDAVLSFGEIYNSFTILSLLGIGTRVFISDRSSPYFKLSIMGNLYKKLLYRLSFGIIAQTSLSKEVAKEDIGHSNITVIPNPIKNFEVRSQNMKRENMILNIGRLIQSKNQDRLMKIFAEIGAKDWKLVFVGDGKERSYYENYARELGIESQVIFVGATHNLYKYLSKSKIFAFTSESEGFPNVLGEAMFFPVASISYDCVAGPSDLIHDGENGFLVPLYDDEAYAEKLKQMIECDSLRDEFEARAMEDKELYAIENIGEQYYNVLVKK